MEAELYDQLYHLVFSTAHPPRRSRQQYNDRWIVMVYLFSVFSKQPVCWACNERKWPRPPDRPLPSQPCMSRRLRTVGVLQLIERLLAAAADLFPTPLVKEIDSKPLTVGAYSKDTDAKKGRVADGIFARGYRMHAIAHGRIFKQFVLMPMNVNDAVVGPILLPQLQGGGYVLGDNAYDTNDCHAAATAANHQLVAPPRACNKGVRDQSYNCQARLRALDIIDSPLEVCGPPPAFGQDLYAGRQRIESAFAGLTAYGLGPLPSWVRRPRRVALWTAGKILEFLCREAINKGLMT
jgi:hypothetical protein